MFGLADLYQLRAGWGERTQAYAYLLLPRDLMGPARRRRINAISNTLVWVLDSDSDAMTWKSRGREHSWYWQTGISLILDLILYCQLLQQAVEKLKGKKAAQPF